MNARDHTFATALNCMDGRFQLPVNEAVRSIFDVAYVDTITEAGIVKFLSDQTGAPETRTALASIRISLDHHGSRGIAVAAHADCAGNPYGEQRQTKQLGQAVHFLEEQFPGRRVVGLWVNIDGVARIVASAPGKKPGSA